MACILISLSGSALSYSDERGGFDASNGAKLPAAGRSPHRSFQRASEEAR